MKEAVTKIIKDFESDQLSADEAIEKIKMLTGRDTDRYSLENYWRSVNIEDYVSQLTEPSIENWKDLTDEETKGLIREIKGGSCSEGRLDQIIDALEKRYRKSEVSDLFFHQDLADEEILIELKKDTVIRL